MQTERRTPLFVRLPADEAERLDDAARSLRLPKGRLVAEAVSRYLDPQERPVGIDALKGAPVGRHSFIPVDRLEVLTLEQLATLLSVEVDTAKALAEAGEIPGRKLGEDWRFSREAVMSWLAQV
jgi:excisionase family DNA binding protein